MAANERLSMHKIPPHRRKGNARNLVTNSLAMNQKLYSRLEILNASTICGKLFNIDISVNLKYIINCIGIVNEHPYKRIGCRLPIEYRE